MLKSTFIDKDDLVKHLVYNCIRIENYQDGLIILEYLRRNYDLSRQKQNSYINFILTSKLSNNIQSITGYLYLYRYFPKATDEFKYDFEALCRFNRDLFYQLNNLEIMYAAGEVSDDVYLLTCKAMQRFAIRSVNGSVTPVVNEIKAKLNAKGIKSFSAENRFANAKIIKWLNKRPFTEKTIRKDVKMKKYL